MPGALVGGYIGDNDFERFRLRVKAGYTFFPSVNLRCNDMKASQWAWLPVAVISTSAYATTYFTVEQAQRAIFPGRIVHEHRAARRLAHVERRLVHCR